ncbi:hypothetical protein [Bifidobacterium subtile]|jgi:thioredoxin reductase (NADPH)|uniref:hypothetical protein n=1 Tax=Bifidobacterium subtile TaxID=77635 RepID=UPI002F35043E
MSMQEVELVIVGSGPVGYTAAVSTDAEGYVIVAHPPTRTNGAGVFAAGTGCASAVDAQHSLSTLDLPTQIESPTLEVSA